MDLLWSRPDPATVRDVQRALETERPLAYTTLMTVMDRLHSKGWLSRTMEGRAYSYQPTATKEEHSAQLMTDALGSSADRTATLVHFLEQMDAADAKRLRSVLDDRGAARRKRGK
jgi:predicted transcriptional regulator